MSTVINHQSVWTRFRQDWSLSATVAGLLAVIISYSGPLVIFFQAAQKINASNEMMASWIWGISIGSAICSMLLSLRYRVPVLLAWSIPGSALLITLFPEMPLSDVIGAYIVAAVVSLIIGVSGYFDKVLALIPQGVAAGMMAGILFQFGAGIFQSVKTLPVLVFTMLLVYVLSRRFSPRYAIVWVLLSGLIASFVSGNFNPVSINLSITVPQLLTPTFSWSATMNFALPLVLLNLTGQFLPGLALLKLNDYDVSSKPIISTASVTSLLIAFVGGISIVQAAVTAALCMGEHCHEDRGRRYIGGVMNGFFYLVGGLFAGSLVGLFQFLPKALVATLAGLALLGALLSNITIAMQNPDEKEAALITFLATVSGMTLFGLGSVFWGIFIGMLTYVLLTHKQQLNFGKSP